MAESNAELEAKIARLAGELAEARAEQVATAIENVRLFDEVEARNRELAESLEQQTASNDVLGVISSSPTDLQPVFDMIAERSARLCDAEFCAVYRFDGELIHFVSEHGLSPEGRQAIVGAYPMPPGRSSTASRAIMSGKVEQMPDVQADPDYAIGDVAKAVNARSITSVPILKNGRAIGAINVAGSRPGLFPARQIALLQTFADQAVIAIENARLFDEVQARNREVSEALEQQTATSEILRVISKSPTDIQPVLKAVATSAAQLCDAYDAVIFLTDGPALTVAAHHGPIPIDFTHSPIGRGWVTGRAVADRVPIHVHDLQAAGAEFPGGQAMALRFGHRTTLAVPLLRKDEAIGALMIRRTELRPFSDKQIALLQTFADQAVIAIENVRLFDEVQARNREVTEALEQQTATGAILRVIAASPTDIQPVLQVVAESAARFCDTHDAVILLPQDGMLAIKAHYGPIPLEMAPLPITRDWVTGRAFIDRKTLHVHDLIAAGDEFPLGQSLAARQGHRTTVATPLMRSGQAVGALTIRRTELRPFSDKQIELLQIFADQAAIAIENVRLFEEVHARNREVTEALEQQTATAEVLKTISSSAFDLDAVLHTLVKSASDLCHTSTGVIYLRDGDVFRPAMQVGWTPDFYEYMSEHPMRPGRGSVTSRAALTASIVHIPDALDDPEYTFGGPQVGHFRTLLGVPLIRDGNVTGVFVLARPTVRPFSQREIELVQTFSDQALIALENVRLFDEVQARNREVTEALEQQTATGAILKVIAASPTDIQPVLQVVAESAARFCDTYDAGIFLARDGMLIPKAHYGPIGFDFPAMPVSRDWVVGRAFADGKTVHVDDIATAGAEFPISQSLADRLGQRTIFATPLMRDNQAIGALVIRRIEVRPFSDKQINLLKTFADQAVIAIENVRLFDEVQARNREVTEALEQQTATGAILKVIAASPTDIQPVLRVVAESAARFCEAPDVAIMLRRGDWLEGHAHYGPIPMDMTPFPIGRDWVAGRAIIDKATLHVPDIQEAGDEYPLGKSISERVGHRTVAAAPLINDDEAIGVLLLRRREAKPFTEKQIALLNTFADQAVIAIRNVRLFEEVQTRSSELGEALQQQTATAEVLKVISRSAFDLSSVLQALIESAAGLCNAKTSGIYMLDGGVLRLGAAHGQSPEFRAFEEAHPVVVGRGSWVGRSMLERSVIHIPDASQDPEHQFPEIAQLGGFASVLCVPLMRQGQPIGVFALTRPEVGLFTDRQVELVQTFADQAVIAIENVRLFEEVQARTAELGEALQQQTATADVLKVISRSAFDLPAVLQTLVDSAIRLCGADMGAITLREGDSLRFMAGSSQTPELLAYERTHPHPVGRGTFQGRAALEGTTIHVADVLLDAEYERPEAVQIGNFRAVLSVPLRRGGEVIGVFGLAKREVGPFAQRQIELVESFADQAVIAIENVRLFDEVQARTAELSEALQQQTATADVLKVISRSAFDLQTVLDTLVESAIRVCEATSGAIFQRRDDLYHFAASFGFSPEYERYASENPMAVGPESVTGRVALEAKTVHITDVLADAAYKAVGYQQLGGYRTSLGVPLLREGVPVGVFVLTRPIVKPFTEKQIELVETFADQAVIAVENVRLFDEVQARTAELGEALQQQTATADVLQVISRSAFDLQTVLDTLTESAVRLCRADKGSLERLIDGGFRYVAMYGFPASFPAYGEAHPTQIGRGSAVGRAFEERRIIQIDDIQNDPDYTHGAVAEAGGIRTVLAVPLLRQDELVGVFAMIRTEPNPFTTREIELVKTFADQAVIAIENVRLFDEVQARTAELSEALQQQTATADVLKAISRSTFDLQPVLDTLAATAVRVCEADMGSILRRNDDFLEFAANAGFPQQMVDYVRVNPLMVPQKGGAASRAVAERRTVHLPDALNDAGYAMRDYQTLGGFRTIMAVPLLLGSGEPIGVFTLARSDVRPFSAKQIELVETFADQAVIAIENVRLFDEVQQRTAELSESLRQQTATADVLKAISRSTFDLQPVLDTLSESAAKLCEADTSVIFKRDGDLYRWSASYGSLPEAAVFAKANPLMPGRDSVTGRVALEARAIHVSDVLADPEYRATQLQKIGGYRTILCVPILREGTPVGVFALTRSEVRDFTPRQIELLETFADQSGIAIENVRLFDEVQARTAELSEALQQQTATADVLQVISRATFDLPAVLDALVASATRLCNSTYGVIYLRDGDALRAGATVGASPIEADIIRDQPIAFNRQTISGRVVLSGLVQNVPDVLADPEYAFPRLDEYSTIRAVLGVPLVRDGIVDGVFFIGRSEPGAFTIRQSELVKTFADQAVIAIQNVRLFDEVQARTRELATSLEKLRTAQDRLVQTEKLASLGQLTAGIAHEIKNPLNFVNNFSALSSDLIDDLQGVLTQAPLEQSVREEVAELTGMLRGNLDKVVQHGKRADSIVRNMLLHSRAGSGEHRPIDINAVVDESLNLAYHGARAEKPGFNVTLMRDFDPQAGDVDLYPQEITRVLLNLISNGFYATAKRKAPANGAAYEPVVTASTKNLGDRVEIRIRDNGTGIPPEVKEKMFNPFFTTKPAGEGTGLGLSLSHDIVVKQHAGTIDVDSQPGEFTEFRIVLPRAAASLGKSGGEP